MHIDGKAKLAVLKLMCRPSAWVPTNQDQFNYCYYPLSNRLLTDTNTDCMIWHSP